MTPFQAVKSPPGIFILSLFGDRWGGFLIYQPSIAVCLYPLIPHRGLK